MNIKKSLIKAIIEECITEVLSEINYDTDDSGQSQVSIGSPNSYERFKVKYPNAIKIVAGVLKKIPNEENQEFLFKAAKESLGVVSEEEQPEAYDDKTDTFAPGPRQRPEDWETTDTNIQPEPTIDEAIVEDKLSKKEQNQIGNEFAKLGLDGNGRFEKVSLGLRAVTNALSDLGFNLDMVSGDLILGDRGNRTFTFRRQNDEGQDIFTEKPEITNSRIVFVWENLAAEGQPKRFEVLAYAS